MRKQFWLLLPFVLIFSGQISAQEILKSDKQIPILAWYSIPSEETSVERYLELRNAGITHSLSFFPNTETMSMALDTAREAGIKMILYCPELKTDTEETVRQFMNHPSVSGYMLRDEPNRTDFPDLGIWTRKIRAIDDNHFCYLNLFPNYATEQQLGTKTYKEHVDLFIEEVPVQMLSFDHYPIIGDSLRENWYENLEIISDASRKAGKPFWAFALSVAHSEYPIPTTAQLRLQVFSDLAYGAQAIQYFTYWTPFDTTWNFNNGPISLRGERTVVYDRIKIVNSEIQKLSQVFTGATVLTVEHTGNTIPTGTKPLTHLPQQIRELKTEGKGAVVSYLKNGTNDYLVIVNRDFLNPMKLYVDSDEKVKRVQKDGSIVPANKYQNTTEIDPGDISIFMWDE